MKNALIERRVVAEGLLPSSFYILHLNFGHPPMPPVEVRVGLRQFVVPGVKEIAQHPAQVEVHEARAIVNQERAMPQHLLEGCKALLELVEQFTFLRAPLIETAAAELALLVTHEQQPAGFRNEFAPVNVRKLETRAFDVVLNVTP